MLKLQLRAPLVAEALRRVLEKFGVDEVVVREALTTDPHVSASTAKSITSTLRRYAAGDWEAAQCVVVPRIETMARSLVLATGAPLWRPQQGQAQGQYQGLGICCCAS